MRARLRDLIRRPVAWGAVLLSYVGIIATTAIAVTSYQVEADRRQSQVCQVIEDVHRNAQFRAATEQRRVQTTVDYLRDPDVPRDALYKRISRNLPAARQDRDVARAAVKATTPPPVCRELD